MKETYLKVTAIAPAVEGKGGVSYKTITLQEIALIGKREVEAQGRKAVRNFWPDTYEREVNGVKQVFKGEGFYNTVQIGDVFQGKIFTCPTTDYRITQDGNVLNSWTGVVFGWENEMNVAAKALRQNDAKPKYLDPETQSYVVFNLPTQTPTVKLVDNEP